MKPRNSLLLACYQFLILPLLFCIAFLLWPFIEKIRKGYRLRNNAYDKAGFPKTPEGANCVWFHCSSGELEYAKPLLRKLKELDENSYIICTYYSPSVLGSLKNTKEVDFFLPMPLENPKDYQNIIDFFKPSYLMVARTDIWPIMLDCLSQNNIPSYLFSATLTRSSGRYKSFFAKRFYAWAHSYFSHIFCVTEEDKECFLELNSKLSLSVVGDTRYDQVLWRLKNTKEVSLVREEGKTTVLCGSTWPQDENEILPCILDLKKKNIGIQWIITPHEPSESHLKKLISQLEEMQISYQLFSSKPEQNTQVMIIDKVGILASVYKYADIAFIGGSFKSSIHSVMEGLAAGCLCVFGPHYKNNREAIEFLNLGNQHLKYANTCNNSFELSQNIINFCKLSTAQRLEFRNSLVESIENRTGVSEKILGMVFLMQKGNL